MDQQYAPLIFTLRCQLQHPRGLELLCQPPGTSLALPCLLCFGVPIFNTNQDHIGSTNTFAKTCANIVQYLPSLYLATLTSFSYHFIIFRFRFLCSLYIHYLILNLLPQPPQQHLWHRCLAAVRQTAWHPKEPGIRYVLRLEKSVFTQRRKTQSPPGRREFQCAFRQIILICLYWHHHASKRCQENPTFTARPIWKKMILSQEKAFCCQVSIKYFDLKAIKLCVRPTIEELLFLMPLDMVAEKYQTCKDSKHTKKMKKVLNMFIKPSWDISQHQFLSRLCKNSPAFLLQFCNALSSIFLHRNADTFLPAARCGVAQHKLIVGFIPLHAMQLLPLSSHPKSFATKPHNSHHYTFCHCRATLLKEPRQNCDCGRQYGDNTALWRTNQT